MKVDFSVD